MGRVKLQQRRHELLGALWVLPAILAIAAIVLGAIVSQLPPPRGSIFEHLLFVGDDVEARRVLLTCATTIVGTLALVIGLTMVALQMAASRYSPRLLRSFVRDRTTQMVIAIFVCAFTYNAAGLYTVGRGPGDYPRLAVTLGLFWLFVCIGALIFYIDWMVKSIQIDRVISGIGITTARSIADHPPGVGGNAGEGCAIASAGPPPGAVAVPAEASGYVEYIVPDRIIDAAKRAGATVLLEAGVGAHVVKGTPVAWLWAEPNVAGPAATATADTAELRDAIDAAVHIGPARSRRQDVAIGIYQIIDIAVLAIHNFDYNTAVQSTNELSILLCKLAPLPLGAEAYQDTAGTTRVVIPARGFDDYLDIACGQIMRRGSREPAELLAMLRMLRDVGTVVRADDRKAAVAAKVREVLSTARESITDSSELARLESMATIALSRLAATPHGTAYRQAG